MIFVSHPALSDAVIHPFQSHKKVPDIPLVIKSFSQLLLE